MKQDNGKLITFVVPTYNVANYIEQCLNSILNQTDKDFKIIIVDDEYMFMGSHNWLSNAGKTEEKKRAIEGTIITTSSDSISYTKEELFS